MRRRVARSPRRTGASLGAEDGGTLVTAVVAGENEVSQPDAGLLFYLALVLVQTVRREWRRWHALRLGPWWWERPNEN